LQYIKNGVLSEFGRSENETDLSFLRYLKPWIERRGVGTTLFGEADVKFKLKGRGAISIGGQHSGQTRRASQRAVSSQPN
jgi:hypothetical protein